MWAATRGQLKVAKVLLEAKADPHAQDSVGASPFILAVQHSQIGVLLLLFALCKHSELFASKDCKADDVATKPLCFNSPVAPTYFGHSGVAMASTFGQPSAGTDQLDWTRRYESAMEAFAKAQSQLEEQFVKSPRDPDTVKFFEGKLEDARKHIEFAQTMLQRCQAAPHSEDILTEIEKLLEKNLERSNEKLEKVKECLILRHLHGESAKWYSRNICTAHIYNKDHDAAAQTLPFDVNDPKNTLLLLRHFELEFDRGRLMLMPVEVGQTAEEPLSLVLKVYIHDELKAENVWTVSIIDRNYVWHEEVKVKSRTGRWRSLTFNDLHGRTFNAAPVYMRSLFLKAVGAHKAHPQHMPNPREFLQNFQSRCLTWDQHLGNRWSEQDRQVGSVPYEDLFDEVSS
ncbi:unnamed protein product [Symbiodinium microadriaticum]|nr:unnamed protein product [Symbiodinium microadriaticum]CAE7941870.1 unnamed protein product [Symbiodinium sp. KB8]